MKYVAWILVIILLALIAAGVYLYMNTNITITSINMSAYPAAQWEDHFDEYKKGIESSTAIGTIFDTTPLSQIDQYVFNTYTVSVLNNSFIPAEMVELQIVPAQGDVLQTLTADVVSIPSKSQGQVSATVLSNKDAHNVRQVIVTYYLWGYYFTLTKTYG